MKPRPCPRCRGTGQVAPGNVSPIVHQLVRALIGRDGEVTTRTVAVELERLGIRRSMRGVQHALGALRDAGVVESTTRGGRAVWYLATAPVHAQGGLPRDVILQAVRERGAATTRSVHDALNEAGVRVGMNATYRSLQELERRGVLTSQKVAIAHGPPFREWREREIRSDAADAGVAYETVGTKA